MCRGARPAEGCALNRFRGPLQSSAVASVPSSASGRVRRRADAAPGLAAPAPTDTVLQQPLAIGEGSRRWQGFWQSALASVVSMSAPQVPASVNRAARAAACLGGRPEVADLLAALARARALLGRVDVRDGKDVHGLGSSALLAGLHLDLAAAELADVVGSAGAGWVEGVGDRADGPGRDLTEAAGRLLVESCLRRLQDRLRRARAASPAGVEPHESLSYTRAVLHLHAAQRAWPAAADGGGR